MTTIIADWSNEYVMNFLYVYQKYRVIWDPKDFNHKNRKALADAWIAIKEELGTDVTIYDLKRKKESLMAIYRNLRKKVVTSMKNNPDDLYKPSWFAYDMMDSFLAKRKKSNKMLDEDSVDIFEHEVKTEPTDIEYVTSFSSENTGTCKSREIIQSTAKRKINSNPTETNNKKPRHSPETPDKTSINTDEKTKKTRGLLEKIHKKLSEEENDECALYGKILAVRLKSLTKRNRKMLINEIDNLVFKAEMREMDENTLDESEDYQISSVTLEDPLKCPSSSNSTFSDM